MQIISIKNIKINRAFHGLKESQKVRNEAFNEFAMKNITLQ